MTTVDQANDPNLVPRLSFSRNINGKLIITLLTITAFGAGAVFGAISNSKAVSQQMRMSAANPESHATKVIQQMDQQLNLRPDQLSQVETFVGQHFANTEAIRQASLPDVLGELARFENEVAQILSPDQQEAWSQQCDWIRRNCYGAD